MKMPTTSLCRVLGATLLMATVAAAGRAAQPPSAAEGDLRPFVDAYIAFFPLYEMARLRHNALHNQANPRRHDLHNFNHVRQLLDHTARTVTAPNNDTLYSSARLDLRHGPVVVRTPAMAGRYYSLQFMNMHTDNVAILGRREQGDGPLSVAVVGPGWSGAIPEHTHRVQSDTADMWLLVRTLVDGPADLAAGAALQDGMRITAPRPAADYPAQRAAPPAQPQPEQFLAVVNEFLERNPPSGLMVRLAQQARPLGIAPGQADAWARLSPQAQTQWHKAVAQARSELLQTRALYAHQLGGWEFPPAEVGQWGNNLLLRAAVALRGIAALDTAETLYLSTFVDIDGETLHGQQRYRVRIPPGGVPARAFWSMTLYEVMPDGRFFLVANPINRYSIGNRTQGLRAGADGALDILVQRDAPADTSNWLPAPPGAFRLTLRAYLPEPALVRGEAPPPRVERLRAAN